MNYGYPGILVKRDAELGAVEPVVVGRGSHGPRRSGCDCPNRQPRATPAQARAPAGEAAVAADAAGSCLGSLQLHGVSPAPIGAPPDC